MKSRKTIAAAVAAACLLLVSVLLLPKAPTPSVDLLAFKSEKSKLMDAKMGHPDMFLQYHHDIRASENGINEYPVGHRLTEFEKGIRNSKVSQTALPWVERGPGNVGGRTRPILVDPDDPGIKTWWAGSVGGGLWKTINGGLAWQYQTDHLPVMAATSLAMAPSNPNRIYLGTGEGYGNLDGVDGNGIFRSDDRGQTWQHLASTIGVPFFRHVNRMVVDPTNPDVLVVATGFGIFRTEDGGGTWTETYTGPGRVQDLRMQPDNFNRLIAGVNPQTILYSDDGGVTWESSSVIWATGAGRVELAFSLSDPDIAYAAAAGGTSSELYRSLDGGASFAPTVIGNPVHWLGGQGWYDNTLAVHPYDPNIVFLGGIGLHRTLVSNDIQTIRGPTDLDYGGTEAWMSWINFGANRFGGTVSYLDPDAVDVVETDYTTIEIRFGQGTQKAHRFAVSETGGANGDGGAGIAFADYMYQDYVDVPFQVWDADNNRQLHFSFRDQADNGAFNLIEWDPTATDRNSWSREYMFIHKYDYDDANPHDSIDEDGGFVNGLLYFMWPVLATDATWDPTNLPNQTMTITYAEVEAYERTMDQEIDVNGIVHVDHHDITTIPVDDAAQRFFVINANDGGVSFSSTSGQFFREVDNAFAGYNTAQFYGVAKRPGTPVYIAGAQDNGTWVSYGNPNNRRGWRAALGGDGFETVWHAQDPNLVLGTIQFSYVLRSTNAGAQWTATALGYDTLNGLFLSSISASDAAPDTVHAIKADGMYRSTDFGASWEPIPVSGSWLAWSGGKVRASHANPDIVWAGYGMDSFPDRKMHVSTDGGLSYSVTQLPTGMERAPETIISGFATHPTEDSTAYGLFSRYGYAKVLETKDLGQTWTDLTMFDSTTNMSGNGFPDVATYDMLVMPHAPNVMWVGTDVGIFVSQSYGKEWNYAHNGLPAVAVWRMKMRDDEIILGTHGRGVWTLPIAEVATGGGDERALTSVPTEFTLSPNYPNPFNATTTIQFTVAKEAPVRISVFDVSGRQVAVLADQNYAPGQHEVQWNANDLASGMYFYRMESAGKIINTHTMTLLK